MKTTPFQIILLAVFGASAVIGVLVFAILTSTSKQSTTGPVVIWGTLDDKVMNQIIQDSANTNPNLAQVTYVQKDPHTYDEELIRALASGTGPDLFVFTHDNAVLDSSEISLIPYSEITPTQFQNLFIDAANPLLLPDGIAGLPFLVDPLVMYWNKDLLSTAGLTQPPQYWSQLFTTPMQSLTKRDDSGTIKQSLIALGEYQNVDHAKDIMSTLIMQVGGRITTRDPSTGELGAALTQPDPTNVVPGIPAETALRFFTEFSDPSKNDYSWNRAQPMASQAFAQGTVALYLGLASEQSAIASTNPNLRFAIARIPQSASGGVTTAHIYALGISKNSKNIVGAKTVAYTLVSKVISSLISGGYMMVSPRRDALILNSVAGAPTSVDSTVNAARIAALASATPEQTVINDSATISRTWSDPNSQKTGDMFRAMIEDTTSGGVLLSEAVSRANAQLLAIIAGK